MTAHKMHPPLIRSHGKRMKSRSKPAPSGGDIQITLGDGWQRFAFVTPGLTFLGTIRRGMEIGALARDDAGAYLQANGDMRKVLNKSRVVAHLRKAGVRSESTGGAVLPTGTERAPVSVVIKRRRRVLGPQI